MVAVQLNILMPVGIPIKNDKKEKTIEAMAAWPDTNIWWPHTRKPIKEMATEERAIAQKRKRCFWQKVEKTSETTPKPGTTIRNTPGCQKNKKKGGKGTEYHPIPGSKYRNRRDG